MNLTKVRKREIKARCKGEIDYNRHEAYQFEKQVTAIDESNGHKSAKEPGKNIQGRKTYCLNRAAWQSLRVGF
jgi:hypothetical protein